MTPQTRVDQRTLTVLIQVIQLNRNIQERETEMNLWLIIQNQQPLPCILMGNPSLAKHGMADLGFLAAEDSDDG